MEDADEKEPRDVPTADAKSVVDLVKEQTLALSGVADFRTLATLLLTRSLKSRLRHADAEHLRRAYIRRFGKVPEALGQDFD